MGACRRGYARKRRVGERKSINNQKVGDGEDSFTDLIRGSEKLSPRCHCYPSLEAHYTLFEI